MATGIEEIARQMEESPQEIIERLEAKIESLEKKAAYWESRHEESCRREQENKEIIDNLIRSGNR